MKISSFMLGGLIGAGAVMYWNRKGMTSTGDMINRMMNRESKPDRSDTAGSTSNSNGNHKQREAGISFEQVERIVSKDPQLKRQVDEIMHSQNATTPKDTPVMTQ